MLAVSAAQLRPSGHWTAVFESKSVHMKEGDYADSTGERSMDFIHRNLEMVPVSTLGGNG